jgi:hypothetical protein
MNSPPSLIRVQGHGSVASSPDRIILSLTLESEHKDYDKAMEDSAQRLELLRQAVAKTGLDPELLKTASFGVDAAQDYDQGRKTFRGYNVRHHLSLELPYERENLGQVFAAVTGCKARAELTLSFTVADPEAVKRRVLEAAVRNARDRAEVIAQAAGRKLGAIHAIDYGHTEITIRSQPMIFGARTFASMAEPEMDFNPADIDSEDTVLVAWELEG